MKYLDQVKKKGGGTGEIKAKPSFPYHETLLCSFRTIVTHVTEIQNFPSNMDFHQALRIRMKEDICLLYVVRDVLEILVVRRFGEKNVVLCLSVINECVLPFSLLCSDSS